MTNDAQIPATQKGTINGVATLDGTGKNPASQLNITNAVSSVNTLTGAVVLSTNNIAENTNLYYTDARVVANASVAANTTH